MYGEGLQGYGNAIETLNNGEQPVVAVAAAMVAAMALVSILVIVLSMNLLVKTMIIKKQNMSIGIIIQLIIVLFGFIIKQKLNILTSLRPWP